MESGYSPINWGCAYQILLSKFTVVKNVTDNLRAGK